MPEIELLRVLENPGDPAVTYDVETVGGETLVADDPSFDLAAMVEIGNEQGVTRWAEATDDDVAKFNTLSYVAERLVLVGWAEAPITRDDVETHSDGYGRDSHPAINIKVHDTGLPKDQAWTGLVDEFRNELDSRLAALPDNELRELVERFLENDTENAIFNVVCESHFEAAVDDAKYTFFENYPLKVWAEGRSGGWLVVGGLPNIESWGPALLERWHEFEENCKALVAHIPRAMAWHVFANRMDELAGRVVRVELTLVLGDADLDELGVDPTAWDWSGKLGLGVDSQVTVRDLS